MRSDVPDVLAPDLRVVFCGINPGRVSAAAHAHFANPRNDFWRLLREAQLTSRLYEPAEQFELLREGIGVTNAAQRTTAGSGDLRRAGFAGAAGRLEALARALRPGWIAFVGKEAYRGGFGERPELGVQERTLGETRLFVVPSTSPANAAVPWRERLRWFDELAGRVSGLPLREAARAVLLDPEDRTLLMLFPARWGGVWATPGGGAEHGESDEDALVRELREECGLHEFERGPHVWTREHRFYDENGFGGQRERYYVVRVPVFEPAPELDLRSEGVSEIRWFSLDELASVQTAPMGLAPLLRDLVERGPPTEPIDVAY